LGQVGVKIILAREHDLARDLAVRRQSGPDRELDDFFVEHRQDAGKAGAHRAGVVIGRRAEAGRAAAEDFRLGENLGVDFQADDGLVAKKKKKKKLKIKRAKMRTKAPALRRFFYFLLFNFAFL